MVHVGIFSEEQSSITRLLRGGYYGYKFTLQYFGYGTCIMYYTLYCILDLICISGSITFSIACCAFFTRFNIA